MLSSRGELGSARFLQSVSSVIVVEEAMMVPVMMSVVMMPVMPMVAVAMTPSRGGRHTGSEPPTVRVSATPSSSSVFCRLRANGVQCILCPSSEGAWRRVARARAQVPRSAARCVPLSGWAAESPAAGGR